MIIKAINDPVVGPDGIDEDALIKNPNIIVAKTQYGGHLSYLESFCSLK